MNDQEGTYASLMELQEKKRAARPPRRVETAQPTAGQEAPAEDLSTTPYISQNYRFTEDELRWLRHQAFKLTEKLGAKVTQNTILRIALSHFRQVCDKSPRNNPLLEALSRLKK